MIHLKAICDTRRVKKNGTHPIVIRISLNGKTRDIPTGYSCKKEFWDFKLNTIKSKSKDLENIGTRVKEFEYKLLDKIRELENSSEFTLNIQSIKLYLVKASNSPKTIHDFWLDEMDRQEKSKRYGNARNLKSALLGISKYQSLEIPFEKVDYSWLIGLEVACKNNGLKANSVAVYMRTLKSIYNKAINHNIANINSYPFRRYKIKAQPTQPRVIGLKDLELFFNYNPDRNSDEYLYWNIGRLIFLLRGINLTDLLQLSIENIKNNRIIYKRSKTHKIYSINLLPLTKAILLEYSTVSRLAILPILTNSEFVKSKSQPLRICQLIKNINNWLTKIGIKLGFQEKLTSYVFRYSYANACKSMGYSKDKIGEALGHNIGSRVTGIYLQDYDIDEIDRMNEIVCNKVISGV